MSAETLQAPPENKNTSHNQSRIPDNAPTISMDLSLKDRIPEGHVIDINYEALHNAIGLDRDNSELTLPVIDQTKNDELGSVDAHYTPGKNRISAKYEDNTDAMNGTLRHELRHYKDDVEGRLGKRARVANLLGQIGVRLTYPSLVTVGIANAANLANNYAESRYGAPLVNKELMHATLGVAAINMLGSSALAGFHWLGRHERAARKAEKQKGAPIIQTLPDETSFSSRHAR